MKNPLWFKAKRYGWGWYPATWQGWLVLTAFIGLIVADAYRIDARSHSVSYTLALWLPDVILLVLVLLVVCWFTGEKPRWRWGGKD